MSRLVFEIGTEAIPATYLSPVLEALARHAEAGLEALRLAHGGVTALGSPNRLVLRVEGLASVQEDLTREVTGPRVDVAFRDGAPTAAAEGFARKNGIAVADLVTVEGERGAVVQAQVHVEGRPAAAVLPDFLAELAVGLSWPKTMRWKSGGIPFPRPVRWVLCLLDEAVLPVTVAGLASGRETRGHRLLGPGTHVVPEAGSLEAVLEAAGVVLDPGRRRETIVRELARAAE